MKGTYFISGIDTNIGKSYATGFLAKRLKDEGVNVITQKFIQTGNENRSEDIELHRKIMGIEMTEADHKQLTYPLVFSYPASPHLAAALDHKSIDLDKIHSATRELEKQYDVVLLEGAGGIMVPVTRDFMTVDYIQKHNYPVILVTSGRLGSINHTLLCFELLKSRRMALHSVIYNLSPRTDDLITEDTLAFIKEKMKDYFPDAFLETLDHIEL